MSDNYNNSKAVLRWEGGQEARHVASVVSVARLGGGIGVAVANTTITAGEGQGDTTRTLSSQRRCQIFISRG